MRETNQRQVDYTKKDYLSLRDELLALARERLPEWTDHSPNDPGVVLVELFSYLGDIILYYQDRIANESYLNTAVERRSVIDLLRLIGYELRPPQPASADLTLLFEDVKTTVTIHKGSEFTTTKESSGEVVRFQYVLSDLDIDLDQLPLFGQPDGKVFRCYTNKLPVIQVDGDREETIGSSDGSRKQRFRLPDKPLIEGQLSICVRDSEYVPKEWVAKETLLYSLSADEHYTVYRDENDDAWVEFGDGQYGKIPPSEADIIAAYRYGGGKKGNVPARSITKIVTSSIKYLKKVYNEQAATSGTDGESLQEAVTKAPRLFRAMRRAVTIQDYEDYAKQFGIGKARARSGPWNVVELCVAPAGGGYPTDTLKADLRAFFEDKRMVTYVVEVTDPVYVPVHIEGNLEVEPFYFTDEIRQKVENAVSRLLAFENVDFEDKLYLSKIYEAVEAIDGVAGIIITRFERYDTSGQIQQPSTQEKGVLQFGWDEIPTGAVASGIELKQVTGGSRA